MATSASTAFGPAPAPAAGLAPPSSPSTSASDVASASGAATASFPASVEQVPQQGTVTWVSLFLPESFQNILGSSLSVLFAEYGKMSNVQGVQKVVRKSFF